MKFLCRNNDCGKSFSTKFNRNKHERTSGHFHEEAERSVRVIPFDESKNLYVCPTVDCKTSSKYKHNIIKHLKLCYRVNNDKKFTTDNKICTICDKHFVKKSNRDRHMKTVHNNDIDNVDNDFYELSDFDQFPSMVHDNTRFSTMEVEVNNEDHQLALEPSTSFSVSNDHQLTPESSFSSPDDNQLVPEPSPSSSSLHNVSRLSKSMRLEHYLNKILVNFDYSSQVNNCVVDYIKVKLKDDKKAAVNYINECFGEMINDDNFLKWLADAVGYKVYSLRNLIRSDLSRNRPTSINCQAIYDFWIQNSVTSNDSVNSTKKITKMAYLKRYKKIDDSDIREEEKQRKKSSNITLIVATKRIYTEPIRKLHRFTP